MQVSSSKKMRNLALLTAIGLVLVFFVGMLSMVTSANDLQNREAVGGANTISGNDITTISANDFSVRIFYNPNGFEVPCITRVLPNGTIRNCILPRYSIRIHSRVSVWLHSLTLEGGGFRHVGNSNRTSLLGAGDHKILPDIPSIWKDGDTVTVVLLVSMAPNGLPSTITLGNISVVETSDPAP